MASRIFLVALATLVVTASWLEARRRDAACEAPVARAVTRVVRAIAGEPVDHPLAVPARPIDPR